MARWSKTLTPKAMGTFIAAVEGGALIEAAAAAAGVALSTLYYRRETDPAFAATWDAAVAKSAGPVLVRGQCGRYYQMQRARRVRFTRERKQIFLDHFSGSCNLDAAAAAAGVSTSTVREHLRTDPAFAEGFQEALALGYTLLEAEAVRQQRAAQAKYLIDPDPDGAAMAKSFDQCMQLLRQWKRRDGTLGPRSVSRQHLTKWSFDAAFEALEKELQVFRRRTDAGDVPEFEDDEEPPAAPAALIGPPGG
jgi:AcrR family transcriptional regulator